LPAPAAGGEADLRALPGGVSNTTHGEGVARGVGYAVGIKNVCFSEGFDDYSTARVRLEMAGAEPTAQVHTAAAEVGQGLVTVLTQIARTELGIERVVILPADTSIGSAGSSSASRQTYVTGGAVRAACAAVREQVLARARRRFPSADAAQLSLSGGKVVSAVGGVLADLADLLGDPAEETVTWRHRPTSPLDPATGQGQAHVQYAFAAHRAVVDVDLELGLVKVVEITTAQDVGKAMNPQAVEGQIHGGIAQGLGLAVMEEIQVADGLVRNPSFTDYLIPTILDMPPVRLDVLELADPHAPYGLRGVGEPPTISSTPAIIAAIRAATGLDLTRVPVRPEHITGTALCRTCSSTAEGCGAGRCTTCWAARRSSRRPVPRPSTGSTRSGTGIPPCSSPRVRVPPSPERSTTCRSRSSAMISSRPSRPSWSSAWWRWPTAPPRSA
jgi:CO/xanthine dehydrogenase Mo-binding subunit